MLQQWNTFCYDTLLTVAVIVITGLGTVAGILAVAIIISESQDHDPVHHLGD